MAWLKLFYIHIHIGFGMDRRGNVCRVQAGSGVVNIFHNSYSSCRGLAR